MSNEQMNQETEPMGFTEDFSLERAKNGRKTAVRLLRQLLQQRWRLLLILLCILISSAFAVLSPALIGNAINQIFDGITAASATGTIFQVNWHTLGGIVGIILALYLLSSLFSYLQQYTMASVAQTLSLSLRKAITEKLNRLPLSYYDRHKKGEMLSRMTNDLEKVADTLQEGLTQLITSVVGILGAFAMMLLISPQLTLIALAAIGASLLAAALLSRTTQHFFARNQEALGKFNASIEESYSGKLEIKAYGREQEVISDTSLLTEELYQAGKRTQFITYAINPAIRLFGQLGYVLVAVRGAFAVIQGQISIGGIQAFFQYVNQVSGPVTEFAYIMNSLQGAIAAAERVYGLLDEEEAPQDRLLPATSLPQNGHVCFEHVQFGYQPEVMLMQDIHIDIKPGSKVAIVGPTGAGKTTLVNLLMRFYELQGGRITIDGIDIAQMRRGDLRSLFGMVLQDAWLFGGTIAENIAYGCPNASPEAIRQAAISARVDHFVRTMPEGYETQLSDEASNLSQGQRQLLTIARAILADPLILILDEATSSVDTRTELEIQKAMQTLMQNRTSFVIAHRLSTIRDADQILVMKDGTIIEQGNHEELLAQKGFYAELYQSQFASSVA